MEVQFDPALRSVSAAKTKISSIQYLRGMAALGVVFFHFAGPLPMPSGLKAAFNFGQSGVHLFFLISGFIIVYSLVQQKYSTRYFFNFLLKRSIRIDPPYYITVILAFLLYWYLSIISPVKGANFPFIPLQFLAHLFYFVPFTKYSFYSVVFWTLFIEFQFYMVIGLLYFLSDSRLYRNAFLIVFSLTCFVHFPNNQFLLFSYTPIFGTGISLVYLYTERTWICAILTILFLILTGYKFGFPIFVLLSTTCLIIMFLNYAITPLAFLGNISYSLYLTHTLVWDVLLRIQIKFHLQVGNYWLPWLLFELLSAVTAACVFYKFIEKPSILLSKKVFYKKTK